MDFKDIIIHDFHKIHGIAHDSGNGIPNKIDLVASLMSRPEKYWDIKKMEWDNAKVINNYRLSILDGHSYYAHSNEERNSILEKENEYLKSKDTDEELFNKLLKCDMLSKFNEAIIYINEEKNYGVWYPYTSLKYHSVLVSSLHYSINIQNKEFKTLYLKIMNKKDVENLFSVILSDDVNNKCFTLSDLQTNSTYEAISKIGSNPMMNFGDVMSRLRGEIYIDKYIYANLRRIKSWSTGLQYYDDELNRVSL